MGSIVGRSSLCLESEVSPWEGAPAQSSAGAAIGEPTAEFERHQPINAQGVYVQPLWYGIGERLVCAATLVLVLPIIMALLALVWLESPGSPLFIQKRVAVGATRPFRFCKIRTMYADSQRRFPRLCSYEFDPDEVANVKLAEENDPRVTRIGAFLRKTSLDELPNLWNVVTGDMRLVGPRPEMWVMLRYYDERTLRKFAVKPGITGYAQILGRGELNFSQTNELDLAYIREASLRTDLRVLWQTVAAVLFQKGAR